MRTGEYFSNGKFLISGEYLVLHGAKSLSVPLRFGQSIKITSISQPGIIRWETYVLDKLWFQADYLGQELEILNSTSQGRANFVKQLLGAGMELNPDTFSRQNGYLIQSRIDFDPEWGMGSSSSLLSNLAYWFDADLYTYYRKVFRGSGFDVFTARAENPVIYYLESGRPVVESSSIHHSVAECLYFVYLGRKQDSQESVSRFNEEAIPDRDIINEVTNITLAMINDKDPDKFFKLMKRHEDIVSGVLGLVPVKQEKFPDFQGEIKSLGAWGGDFIMAGTFLTRAEVKDYFKDKGLDVVFGWNEIVL